MDLAACDGIGQSQDGLITRRQALQVLTKNQIDALTRDAVWRAIYPGVYRMTGVPDSWRRRVRAATLVNSGLLASHLTAAYIWGLIDRQPRSIELLTKAGKSADLPGVVVHRTRRWFEGMGGRVDGIAVTNPARTLIELSRNCSFETLRGAVDRALTGRVLKHQDLVEEFERLAIRPGRNFTLMSLVLNKRDEQFERLESPGEADILEWIREANLPVPVEQFRLPVGADDTFRPDYAYPQLKIAIEVQSWRWHGGPARYENDAKKAITLMAMGWIVLPVLPRPDSRAAFIQALRFTLATRSAA
jgi:hypothetical protein